jgi:hypothetical protein
MSPFGTSRKSGTPSRMSAIGGDRTTSARSELYRFCRVGPGSLTPSPSQIPDVNLSIHPARVTARRLPPSADALDSSRYDRLAQVNGDDLPPRPDSVCVRDGLAGWGGLVAVTRPPAFAAQTGQQAEGFALSQWALAGLAQDEEPERARCEARVRGGLGRLRSFTPSAAGPDLVVENPRLLY